MSAKRYGFTLLFFVVFILIVFFAMDSILASPGVVNSTAFNITSNADLNLSGKCQPNCARFVDGKIVGAAGNKSNLTGWETWSDNELLNNPEWTLFNMSNSFGSGHFQRTRADQGFLNLTSNTSGTMWTTALRTGNISMPSSGIIVDFWIKPIGAAHTNWNPVFCFDFTFDRIANRTTLAECNMPATAGSGALILYFETSIGQYRFQKKDGGGASTIVNFGQDSSETDWEHWSVWVNQTHTSATINLTEGGGSSSGLIAHDIVNNGGGSGAIAFDLYRGTFVDEVGIIIDNLSIVNATQFGQPYNLTPAILETNIMDNIITATSVKVSNQSVYYASGSSATFQVFDNNHNNTQAINEGLFSSSNNITGIGGNITFIPSNNFMASEFTSFLYEWNILNVSPLINKTPDVSINHYTQNLSVQINVSDVNGDAIIYSDNTTLINISSTGFIDKNATLNDFGNHSINITASDGVLNASFQFWFNITQPSTNVSFNATYVEPSNDLGALINYSGINNFVGLVNETIWFKNGIQLLTADNVTFLIEDNYTFNDVINFSVRLSATNEKITFFSENITIRINDTISSSFVGNVSNQTSVTVNIANTFEINITDTGSNLTSVTAEFEDVNQQKENLTLSNSSLNSAGQNIRFNGSYTPNVAGTWYLKFYAEDFAGNVNRTPDRFMQFTVNAAGNGGGSGGGGGGGGGSSDGCAANYANVNNTCVPVGNLTKAERCGDSFCDALLGEDPFNCLKDCPYQAASFTCSDPTKPCLFNNQSFVATIVIGIFALGVIFLQLQIRSVDDAKDKFRQLRNKLKSTVFRRKF